jgi:hypothetical protein
MKTRILHTKRERKTTLYIDQAKLSRARKLLGTRGIKDTVDGALQEVFAVAQRRLFAERLRRMDGTDLADEKVMSEAWQ